MAISRGAVGCHRPRAALGTAARLGGPQEAAVSPPPHPGRLSVASSFQPAPSPSMPDPRPLYPPFRWAGPSTVSRAPGHPSARRHRLWSLCSKTASPLRFVSPGFDRVPPPLGGWVLVFPSARTQSQAALISSVTPFWLSVALSVKWGRYASSVGHNEHETTGRLARSVG